MTFARFASLVCGRIAKEFKYLRECINIHKWVIKNRTIIPLEFSFNTQPRYGYGKPVHEELLQILDSNRTKYSQLLEDFQRYSADLTDIPMHQPTDPKQPYWENNFYKGLDPISLYSFMCIHNPKTYIEIGSGMSTRFARKAVQTRNLQTKIISIDPYPRLEINQLCDTVIRNRFEDADLGIFDKLQSGDIVMMDGSHYCLTNSDVTVFFLEVLPRLKPGVIVHLHDIYMPEDYPSRWSERYYSEQYLLSVLLMASDKYEILMPCHFVHIDDQLNIAADKLLNPLNISIHQGANSFWMQVK